VYNELAQLSNFEDNSMEIRKIRKNIYMLEKEIKNLNEKEEKITQYLLDSMQTRDKILKKIKSK
jgi:septal ring factor EnvC (AmiA/AmiB activator)